MDDSKTKTTPKDNKSSNTKVENNTRRKKRAGSGRKKGTPNKKSLLIHQQLQSAGFDFGKKVAELWIATEDPALRIELLKTIAGYYPKLKDLDFSDYLKLEAQEQENKPAPTSNEKITLLKNV